MDNKQKKELMITANNIRRGIIDGVYSAGSGHPGGSLSIADVLAYLYFKEMRIDPKNPDWEDRDRLVLSKGHTAPGLYSALANRGYFPVEELKTLRKPGSFLQGHPDMRGTPGCDMSSGSLGQGISVACGMALASKLDGDRFRVYAIMGDGELEEGQVWEAAMFAGDKKLDTLCAIVDNNNLQIDGTLDEVNAPYPIDKKFEAFNFNVIKVNGHNFDELDDAFTRARATKGMPTVIVMNTVKGKGVSFMENKAEWHGAAPNDEQYRQAMHDLDEIEKSIK